MCRGLEFKVYGARGIGEPQVHVNTAKQAETLSPKPSMVLLYVSSPQLDTQDANLEFMKDVPTSWV